jgi:septum site-determining protein MinC
VKTRGTRGGIVLSLEASDRAETLAAALTGRRELFSGKVFLEIPDRLPWPLLAAAEKTIAELGGEVADVRPPTALIKTRGETVILGKTVRSGAHVESNASVVVLGDVNAGAEIIAADDIIVLGALRGLAHAGAGGNEKALIWAQQILSPQLRIGETLAQADGNGQKAAGPEVAHLANGQIMVRPWEH